VYNYIGLEPRREAMHWQFGEMEFGEMKRNTSNWSNFGMLLRRAGLTASARKLPSPTLPINACA